MAYTWSRRLLATISLAGLFALAGCGGAAPAGNSAGGSQGGSNSSQASTSAGGKLTLVVITSITGADSEFGKAQKEGYEIAKDEINAAGGIAGKQVDLVYLDDKSSAQEAAKDVDQAISQYHAQLILGPYSSGSALAVVKKADTYKVPDIVPTATAANVTQTGSKYVFRLCATSDDYAKAICELLKQQGDAKTMAIVHEDQNFGTSAEKAMLQYAKQYGFQVVDDESYSTQDLDYKAMLQRVKQHHPDVIYFASYSKDAVALMKQAQEIDLDAKYFTAAGTGFSVSTFPQDAGSAAEYTLAAGQWDPSAKWQGSKEFYEKVHQKFGDYPSYHDMEAYAALY
ncbi:MAG: ABC transporter substrate-binding protein, partial [Alicyclobacillus sp.]|nr:ABC transporter substrate-binding protein [Alicyclobacillus sp.]